MPPADTGSIRTPPGVLPSQMPPEGSGDHDMSLLWCIAEHAIPLLVQWRKEDVVALEDLHGVVAGGVAGTGGGIGEQDK